MAPLPPNVPFTRKLDEHTVGHDVVAVKRALSRAGHMQWGDFTEVWGKYAAAALKSFEKAKGLKQTGEYTFTRHEALRKTHRDGSRIEWAFDHFAIAIMKQEDVSPYERRLALVIAAVDQAILRRAKIAYDMIRPYRHGAVPEPAVHGRLLPVRHLGAPLRRLPRPERDGGGHLLALRLHRHAVGEQRRRPVVQPVASR